MAAFTELEGTGPKIVPSATAGGFSRCLNGNSVESRPPSPALPRRHQEPNPIWFGHLFPKGEPNPSEPARP